MANFLGKTQLMKKFLIAMVLLTTGIKLISGCIAFNNDRYSVVHLDLQAEENGHEKKEEPAKDKIENEDKIFPQSPVSH